MDWLNYHHLLYFWMTAKEGSIVKASELLHLTPPTVTLHGGIIGFCFVILNAHEYKFAVLELLHHLLSEG